MTAGRTLHVGTRGSALALIQTREALGYLTASHPDMRCELVTIRTRGDKAQSTPLSSLGKGVFVKELELALLDGTIDLAVHSLKDLPSLLSQGLVIAAYCRREDARDVLIARSGLPLDRLPRGAKLGTSSPRRAAQIRAYRPDLETVSIRGNVDTRIKKALQGDLDGIVVAAAGVHRLGQGSQVTEYLSPELCLPEAGQGVLAIEARHDDGEARSIALAADHLPTRRAALAERAFLASIGGGCKIPVTAYGTVTGEDLTLRGMAALPDGSRIIRATVKASVSAPEAVGKLLYERLMEQGAQALLRAS